MQDAVFSIISLKVLLIRMLLLCSVDGPILPARSRVKLTTFHFITCKAPNSQEVHLNISYPQGLINLVMAGDSQDVIWDLFRAWGFRVYEGRKKT